jgi:hypothetical protein
MTEVKNSHYISQVLLRNWEREPGELHYFEFSTGRVGKASAKSMYRSPTPFPHDVEQLLSARVETPLGEYFAAVRHAVQEFAPEPPVPTPPRWIAIMLAVYSQPDRNDLANGVPDPENLLGRVALENKQFLQELFVDSQRRFEWLVCFAGNEKLFMPDSGIVPLPVLSGNWAGHDSRRSLRGQRALPLRKLSDSCSAQLPDRTRCARAPAASDRSGHRP